MSISPISLVTCLFFETQAEEAARYYVSIFTDSSITPEGRTFAFFFPPDNVITADLYTNPKIDTIAHFTSAGQDMHKQSPGTVMSVSFTLNGTKWLALNSRPKDMAMTEAVSFQILCDGQEGVDHYWEKLTEGISEEDRKKQMCGWLRDRFGVSWQVVPRAVVEGMSSGDEKKMAETMKAIMKPGKIVVKEVVEAAQGK